MYYPAKTPQEYIEALCAERKEIINRIREVILKNLPEGFEEVIGYGMLGYGVRHSIYPNGYHCEPNVPLPYINLASEMNFITLYDTCFYGDDKLKEWLVGEYSKHCKTKLNIDKAWILFKKMVDIPYRLTGELAGKRSPQQWAEVCQKVIEIEF